MHLGWFKKATVSDFLSLSAIEQIGPASWQKLYSAFPTIEKLLRATLVELRRAGLTDNQAHAFLDRPTATEKEEKLLKHHSIDIVTLEDSNYPGLLKEINDPPLWLFYRGDLNCLSKPTVTVVGSRKPSAYALEALKLLFSASFLSQVTTVSGLAYGVDKTIHQSSLAADGTTVAVLAGGLDAIYPVDHTHLASEIVERGGLLLSEYSPLDRPQPYKFPVRNRIVAGLSPATVIIEAKIKSGTLTTAASAIDYNRDVFALPGDMTRETAAGGNLLIKRGAMLLDDPAQLLEYYGLSGVEEKVVAVDSAASALLHLLTSRALDLDEMVSATGQTVENLLGLVTELELSGLVYQPQPGRYQKTKN